MYNSYGLYNWRKNQLKDNNIRVLWYLSHIDNFSSILRRGILPKNIVEKSMDSSKSFADEKVQSIRHKKSVYLTNKMNMNIHDLVPLYFTTKTPTLYARKDMQDNFFYCQIGAFFLCKEKYNFSFFDGNAASKYSKAYTDLRKLSELPWHVIRSRNTYTGDSDYKRKKCAEILIHPSIPTKRIYRIYVNNENTEKRIISDIDQYISESPPHSTNILWAKDILNRVLIDEKNDHFFE